MKQSILALVREAFPGSSIVLRFSFKAIRTRDNCALLAVQNHRLAMIPVISMGQSAHFWKTDCFECLPPHIKVSERIKKARSAKIAA
jgi:hypothetical protein